MNDIRDRQRQIRDLSEELLGDSYSDQLVRAVTWLCHSQTPPDTRSRLGGTAMLARNTPWPFWRGRPLSFLALVDCAEIAPFDDSGQLPKSGLLNFFYEADGQEPGFDPDPALSEGWRLIFTDAGEAVECPAPDGALVFPEHPLRPVPALPVVGSQEKAGYLPVRPWDDDDDDDEGGSLPHSELPSAVENRLQLLESRVNPDQEPPWQPDGPLHKVGGWPDSLHDDPLWWRAQLGSSGFHAWHIEDGDSRMHQAWQAGPSWRLLLQLDSDPAMEQPDQEASWVWGDGGRLYFVIRADALKAGDFSQVWLCAETH
ncbi:DUF1963 domain-containing protein [Nonomuraea sp. KC401]|uniref:DUF1963 domain-containing protein n=1 Tax=unclassified Nonomuraea TaxID=2593643 RepID=UPI0010FE81D8|nr:MULTISPECIES: YwqG family protein [unclassified Nonomuraea]NBE97245.1 DUF1963 domain-containing protein [Nonomuraea sp. K271]TLF65849.1 DUF1963 domain-containing protein [Nonomuraea sp. KC401]